MMEKESENVRRKDGGERTNRPFSISLELKILSNTSLYYLNVNK